MKSALVVMSFVLAAVTVVAAPGKPRKEPDVLVVADLFEKERTDLIPTPEMPVYYIILGGNEWTIGQPVAGERLPKKAELELQIEEALAPQGYLRTQIGGPVPGLVLVYTFGSANLDIQDTEWTNVDSEGESSTEMVNQAMNGGEISRLLGLGRARNRMLSPGDAMELNQAANEDRLYLMVAALEAKELRKKNKVCVWRTWMSVPSVRNWLNESIPTMLTSGAPWFGKETTVPTFVRDTERKARVIIGEPRVLPDDEQDYGGTH